MFNLAIDSKLRGCDVVAIRAEDVAAGGYTADRATVRQKKTGRPVRFELSDQTRQAIDDYLKAANKRLESSCSPDVAVLTAIWRPAINPSHRQQGIQPVLPHSTTQQDGHREFLPLPFRVCHARRAVEIRLGKSGHLFPQEHE